MRPVTLDVDRDVRAPYNLRPLATKKMKWRSTLLNFMTTIYAAIVEGKITAANAAVSVLKPHIKNGMATNTHAIIVAIPTCDRHSLFLAPITHP